MENEQTDNILAWLQAIRDENKKLNAQIKHMTGILEAVGLHTAAMKKDAETTRFRIGALCLCFIVIPIVFGLALCTFSAGAAAGKAVKEAPAAERSR